MLSPGRGEGVSVWGDERDMRAAGGKTLRPDFLGRIRNAVSPGKIPFSTGSTAPI